MHCAIVLKDGRFAIGYWDKSIIIYNIKTYKPDLIIKEHNDSITCLLQLSSDILDSCSIDKTIKLFNIDKFQVIQTLNYHKSYVSKIIGLNNKNLVSCSEDRSIIFYDKDNNDKYKKDYHIKMYDHCFNIIQTKKNEICYNTNSTIFFNDLINKKVINKIIDIHTMNFQMIAKDLLLIVDFEDFYVINTS